MNPVELSRRAALALLRRPKRPKERGVFVDEVQSAILEGTPLSEETLDFILRYGHPMKRGERPASS